MKTTGIAEPRQLTLPLLLSSLTAALVVIAALPGVLMPSLYHDTPSIVATNRGSDLFALVVAVPTLVVSLVVSRRGSLRAQIVWLGIMSWVAYNYVVYAYGLNFTTAFLAYVAIVGLTIFTLALVLRRANPGSLDTAVWSSIPRRVTAVYLWTVGAFFSVLWLADVIPATLNGGTPARLVDLKATSNPVEINDLAIIIPTMVLAGVWIWQRRPAGYLLAGSMLGIATFTMGALVPGGPIFAGQSPDLMFGSIALVSLVIWLAFLVNVKGVAPESQSDMNKTVVAGRPLAT